MTIPFIMHVTTLMLLSKLWECQRKSDLNGLEIIKWKTAEIGSIWYQGDSSQFQIGNSLTKGILCEKLLSVKFDHKLAFDQNVKSFDKKAIEKLKALARIVPCIVLEKNNLRMNSFFAAQFSHCLLIWMVYRCFSKKRVKHLNTWKMLSREFLLLNKSKNHNKSYSDYKNNNLVSIPNGVSFLFWFQNLSKNQTFPGQRIKVVKVEKNAKMNTIKQNYCAIYISIEQLVSLNDLFWVIVTVPINIFNKIGR